MKDSIFKHIFHRCKEAMCITSDSGQFIQQNPAHVSAWGWTNEDFEAESNSLSPILGQVAFETLLAKATEDMQTEEHLGMRKDGVSLLAAISFYKVVESGSFIIFLVQILSNVNENKMEQESEIKFKLGSIANISHELRAPINSIIGNSELLLDTILDTEQKELAVNIGQSSEALLSIINNVLDTSKLEFKNTKKEITSFSIMEVVDSCISVINLQLSKKNLKLQFNLNEGIPHVLVGDKNKIRQVLTNLLTNAVKFTSSGEITLALEVVAQTSVDCTLLWKVSDTGTGISKEGEKHLFKAFSQVDIDPAKLQEGTGLGLYLCKNFVESFLGGKIWYTPIQPSGSCFQFTTRLGTPAFKESIYPSIAPKPLEGKKFYIEKVNPKQQTFLAWALEGWGAIITKDVSDANGCLIDRDYLANYADLKNYPTPVVIVSSPEQLQGLEHVGKIMKPLTFLNLFHSLMPQVKVSPFPAGHKPRGPLKILIAEDDRVNQKVFVRLLASLGFHEVDVVQDGLEVLTQLEKKRYDLIFMDVRMPLCDGFQCTERIRRHANEHIARIPIIGVTADATEQSRLYGMTMGMTNYITKPFKRVQLEKLLAALM